ncbi:transmembrane protein, putative (macronuclear) [Tetrahymena thermophila SB210]|uniref:Transmembrane protein, putative n=1 Tax=Tetrahymena thermophila (strain SB210) TaxID=312017 RepID=I7MCX0_TETTS|nr:transmembrane protein, putative [Tetrahymena thermophila SB210]EAR85076.1 transmembrane protein, putative [Tetrahymena thermophila SB210]|eukprot:XP_001032739.1 transmembrane protein, putative [Tetrahymena thermophila SB210]
MKKYIFTNFLLCLLISYLQGQRLSDPLQGDLLQTGEIILRQVKQNTTVDIIYQQKIVQQDYNVVLSLKRVEYQEICQGQYQFEMSVLLKQEDKFVLKIQNYDCLRKVELQWFAHTYQANSVNETAYFREQIYQKNMAIKGNRTISQEYLFDIKKNNRDILPLFTGFQLYPKTRIELITNRIFDRITSKVIQTNLNIYDYSETQNKTSKQVKFTMSFIIAHPSLFSCQKRLNTSESLAENALVLQNIEYLDTTQGSQEGNKLVCYFKQYNSSQQQQLQSQFTPLKNPIQYYINGKFQEKDNESNEDNQNNENENNQNEKENDNIPEIEKQEKNKLDQNDYFELFQTLIIIVAILTLLSGIIYKICKESQKSTQQFNHLQDIPQYQVPHHHVELQEE